MPGNSCAPPKSIQKTSSSQFSCPLPVQCPLVIEDFITVVKELGLCYLWVDLYCIGQTNKVLKQSLISRMDLIYKWSKSTIIVVVGQDSTHGLPGVRRRSRLRQLSIDINGQTLLAILADPVRTLQIKKWNRSASHSSLPTFYFIHRIQPDAQFCLQFTRQLGASNEDGFNRNLTTKIWLRIILGHGRQTRNNYILYCGKATPRRRFSGAHWNHSNIRAVAQEAKSSYCSILASLKGALIHAKRNFKKSRLRFSFA